MTKETEKAAQVDPLDAFVQEVIDQGSEQKPVDDQPVESAPTKKARADEPALEDKPVEDGFQKRINKVTADKYTAIRERDELQSKLDALSNSPSQEQVKAPTLEDFDYDNEKHNAALIEYGIKQEMQKLSDSKAQDDANKKAQNVQNSFNERIVALGKDDFADKANAIPELPDGVADALMQSDDGAELIYYLGTHLDKADALAGMTPSAAMMELGKLSVEMSKKPEIKTSAAPEPIEPIKAGSAISSDIGDEMSIDAWMAKYN